MFGANGLVVYQSDSEEENDESSELHQIKLAKVKNTRASQAMVIDAMKREFATDAVKMRIGELV